MARSLTLFLPFGAAHATALCLSTQEPQRVSGVVSCRDCMIALDTVLTIGGLDGPGLHLVTTFSHVAVDRRGRFLVTSARQSEISVFDSTGKFLRTLGRRGEGPGEYGFISHVGVGTTYIHVFEYHSGRTMLDHDFAVVRTDRFPGQIFSVAVMSDDEVVFAAEVPTPESVGHELHVLHASGEIGSYGYDGGVYPSGLTTWTSQRSNVAGRDDIVWVVPDQANRLVRWDLVPEPRVGRVIERHIAEFGERGMNTSAMLDERGLWIIWHGPDGNWTRTLRRGDEMPSEPRRRISDGWLDLVDPATGLTLARHRQDGVFQGFAAGSGYVVAYHETDAGVPFLHILEPRLLRGSAARTRKPE